MFMCVCMSDCWYMCAMMCGWNLEVDPCLSPCLRQILVYLPEFYMCSGF